MLLKEYEVEYLEGRDRYADGAYVVWIKPKYKELHVIRRSRYEDYNRAQMDLNSIEYLVEPIIKRDKQLINEDELYYCWGDLYPTPEFKNVDL